MGSEKEIMEKIRRIGKDNISGASELAWRASEVLVEGESSGEMDLYALCMELLGQQPSMAPIINLVSSALHSLDEQGALTPFCSEFSRRINKNRTIIAESGAELILDGYLVATHSSSSTVREALKTARERNREFRVLCSEGRPVNEGTKMAEYLHRSGVDVTIMTDAMLMDRVADADILIVGADSISPAGLVNKVGTRSAAMRAKEEDTGVISLCSMDKFLPRKNVGHSYIKGDPKEVYRGGLPIKVINEYFDLTPLGLIDLVITEAGSLDKDGVEIECGKVRLHDMIMEALELD